MRTDTATDAIVPTRMRRQGLWQPSAPDVPAVLRSLIAMQGQEFGYALWALAQRVRPDGRPTQDQMRSMFDRGEILRTHVLRPTWHLVLPQDVRWLLRLTAPRLRRQTAFYDRQLGLDRSELDRAEHVLAAEAAGGRHRTRKQLAIALNAAGVKARGQRLGHLMMHAELDEVLISGAMAGRQQTYAAFDERVPPAPASFDADATLADLTHRYVATRAPVTAKDLAGWASLTVAQARAALDAVGCERREVDGMMFYGSSEDGGRARSPRVDLVQGYDEMIMSYSQSRPLLTGGRKALPVPDWTTYLHAVLIDGALAGHWRHRLAGTEAVVQAQPTRTWSASERRAVAAAVRDYGMYLGRPTWLE